MCADAAVGEGRAPGGDRSPRLPGRGEVRLSVATSSSARRMSSSSTAIAKPPLSRTARRIRKSPIAAGTRMPAA